MQNQRWCPTHPTPSVETLACKERVNVSNRYAEIQLKRERVTVMLNFSYGVRKHSVTPMVWYKIVNARKHSFGTVWG